MEIKNLLDVYKSLLTNRYVKIANENAVNDNLIEPYAIALKTYVLKDENENLNILLKKLDLYFLQALNSCLACEHFKGHLELFIIMLLNKLNIKENDDKLPLKIWNIIKEMNISHVKYFDLYSQLVALIFEQIPNDNFENVTSNYLKLTVRCFHFSVFLCIKR